MNPDPLFPLMDPIRQLNLPLHSRVLIAVSGGPDSVALALAFHAVARESRSGWSLRLGHVNHGLRGDETAEDEAFVSELARELELPLDVSHVDTAAYAGQHHLSLETAARDQRYAALGTMLAVWPGELLATAHTRDDQAATVLLHLARGAGLHGLTGIWPERGGLIRPFLSLPRATILASLDAARQPYRLDSSNMDPRHSRNRVEHELMPLIDAIQPGASAAVARSAASLTADRDYLDLEAEELDRTLDVRQDALGVSASAGAFRVLHPAMQRIVLRRLIGRAVGELHDVEYEHVELMREAILAGESAARLLDQLPRGLGLTVNRAQFYIGTSGAEEILVIEPTTLSVPGSVKLTSGVLECEILSDLDHSERSRLLAVCGPYHALCDARAVGASLHVRSRQPGDRMQPLGMSGSRKVQDLLVDHKVPRQRRDCLPILENDLHPVWIPGICLDRRAAITPDTVDVAHLRFRPFV